MDMAVVKVGSRVGERKLDKGVGEYEAGLAWEGTSRGVLGFANVGSK